MNIRTILVPVDFSTCSMLVTRQAAGLAKQLDARLHILHVTELPAGVSKDTHVTPEGRDRTAADYLVADSLKRLESFAATARAEGIEATTQVEVGPVVPSILAATEAAGAELIVIGTHGRTGFARIVLGSVAESVAHKAHVPVMLVRRETRPECARASCEWCPHSGLSPAEEHMAAETEG